MTEMTAWQHSGGALRILARTVLVVVLIGSTLLAVIGFQLALGRDLDETVSVTAGGALPMLAIQFLIIVRRRRMMQEQARSRGFSPKQYEIARRASVPGGPIPDDPSLRVQAARMLRDSGLYGSQSSWIGLAAIIVGAVVTGAGGFRGSHWWWLVSAALVVLGCIWTVLTLSRARQLRRLTAGLDIEPTEVFVVPPRASSDVSAASGPQGLIRVHPRHGLGWNEASLLLEVDDIRLAVPWTPFVVRVPAGRHKVSAQMSWFRDFGQASMSVDVPAGAQADVHYSAPQAAFLRGRIGVTEQPVPGKLAVVVVLAVLAAAILALIVFT